MPLTEDEVTRLDDRAREVGRRVGWDLKFVVAPNPEFVGLAVGSIFIKGLDRLNDLAYLDIDLDLDAIERGDRRIVFDEDGDPRLL
ncbi:hypothetical protein [Nocardioides jejuensis]|uniref:Uncharacterized protein n=1 Tax=Nocardioides jejuensis TaxID=2502782 RepID=A0A4R1BWC6_9ACTN|nr:hypothetical protein [Nocardioides jejuensis]TCJ21656.1 hypothetical protein EPD65_14610 [Nocardioides jejuensis]